MSREGAYHQKQHNNIYQSTVHFIKFIEKFISLDKKNLIDLACGSGANTLYLGNRYSKSNFTGIDSNKKLILIAKKKIKVNNVKFIIDDWININQYNSGFDGILSFQSLSFINLELEKAFKNINKKNSLFLHVVLYFSQANVIIKLTLQTFLLKNYFKVPIIYILFLLLKKFCKKKGTITSSFKNLILRLI